MIELKDSNFEYQFATTHGGTIEQITEWAADKVRAEAGLMIYLVDHGGDGASVVFACAD